MTEDGKIDLSNIRYIAEDDFSEWTKRILPKAGDIIFSYEATLNRYAIIPEGFKGCLGRRLGLIRTSNLKVNNIFLFYYFFSDDWRATISQNILFGATVNRIPVGKLPDFKIFLPSLDVQNKIAAVLSALDAKIELNDRINAELETMAKTLYDYWFVQFEFPDENGKPYKSSGGKMVYNQTLKREIPEGWKDNSLWNIANYYNGLAMQKYRPNTDDYLRVIKIKEMNEGFSDKTEKARVDIPKNAIVNDGDVLFSWSATLEVKIWTKSIGALNQHIFKVSSQKYPKLFYYFELLNYLNHLK
ncbi:MAG: restriction endonuclease subunit S [Hydrococcus sp. SU_1_0]|nr:restriction endonuclease subunit S [Hydrococcus sp. SU_1_0]